MGFQICPLCKGSGTIVNGSYSAGTKCPVCHGTRIINELTGLPPMGITKPNDNKITNTDNINAIGQQLDLNYQPRLSEDVQERIEYYSNLKK